MPIYRRQRVTAAKIEATAGTAESLSASDAAMNIYNAVILSPIERVQLENQGGMGMKASRGISRKGIATFRTYAEWDGTSTEPMWADTFFPACGYVKSGGTYTPRTAFAGSDVKTLTIGVYNGGKRRIIYGAMGNWVATLVTPELVYFDWTFEGIFAGEDTTAMLEPTYPTPKSLKGIGLAEWNDIDFCPKTITINANNELYLLECPNSPYGYKHTIISNRRPAVTADPESVQIATQDRWAHMLDDTEYALEIDINGPGNSTISFDAPKAQLINLGEGERQGIVTDDTEWQCNINGSTQDQELSIVFTAAT
jgi:hypothetical protein